MAYATLSDLRDRASGIRIGGSGGFDPEKAERIIESINKQVESMIRGLGYQVPVLAATSPESFSILKDIVISGSIAQILKAMYYGVRDPEEIGANDAWREYTGKLKHLADANHPLTLVDATRLDVGEKIAPEVWGNFEEIGTIERFRPTRDQVF